MIWSEGWAFYGTVLTLTVALAASAVAGMRLTGLPITCTAWAYFMASAAGSVLLPVKDWNVQDRIQASSGLAFAYLALFPLVAFLLRGFDWKRPLIVFALVEAALIWARGGGFFSAPSMGGAFCAWAAIYAGPVWAAVLAFTGLFHGSTAVLILAVYALARWPKYAAMALAALLAVGLAVQGADLLSGNGRITAWGQFMQGWLDMGHFVTGTGVGSFEWLAPAMSAFKGPLYFQMHNDWLQALFEGGWVGLGFLVAAFAENAVAKRGADRLAVLGMGAFMVTYHPFHFPMSGLAIAFLALSQHGVFRRGAR